MLIKEASWISLKEAAPTTVPVFRRQFPCEKPVRSAILEVTCDGVYEAVLNGKRVGEFILAPGWIRCMAGCGPAGSIRRRESVMRSIRLCLLRSSLTGRA